MGLVTYDKAHLNGYYLYTPLNSKNTYLIDECGNSVNVWKSTYKAGVNQFLTEDGSMYRAGLVFPPKFGLGSGGIIEKFDWKGNITWKFKLSDSLQTMHHDIEIMPNGHILAIVWERISKTDAVAAGRKSSLATPSVWNERIIEIQPIGADSAEIVWEWSAWEHVIQDYDNGKPNYGVVADHPERLDLNYTGNNPEDWLHVNSVDYNAALDQIVISAHATNEIYIIDHSTNSVQAAGHSGGKYGKGGDILYRWGNPQAYQRGNANDQTLFHQHHAHWIKTGFSNAGKIMIFNNGMGRPAGNYSSVDIIAPFTSSAGVYTLNAGQPYGPTSAEVGYVAANPTDFYATNMSGVYSLPGGGLLMTAGPQGALIETDSEGKIVWQYNNPINDTGSVQQGASPVSTQVFRAAFYPLNYQGFSGKNMTAGKALENNPKSPTLCEIAAGIHSEKGSVLEFIYPNPANEYVQINGDLPEKVSIADAAGKIIKTSTFTNRVNTQDLSSGLYQIVITQTGKTSAFQLAVEH